MEKIAVNLDWLSVNFQHPEDSIPTPPDNDPFTFEAGGLNFEYTGGGQQHYKHIWKVNFEGEQVATLLSHTRNVKFVKANHCKVDFKNHLLYSAHLWPIYETIVMALTLLYKSINRVDIALDNANALMELCNLYAKQTRQTKVFEFKGRPRIDNKVLDRVSMMYQNFTIGTPGSGKYITIYNKSLEITRSRKEYIQDFWKQNGIIEKLTDLEATAKRLEGTKEPIYIEGQKNIFRFEIRLSGRAIKEIDGFKMELLRTVDGLMSIVKLHTIQFFDAFWTDDPKTTRCTPMVLFPYENFNIIPLKKAKLQERDDLYKTKLSINKNVKQLFTGKLDPENASVQEMILFDIQQFNLKKWFEKKYKFEWLKTYSKMNHDKNHVEQVTELINNLIENL